MLIGFVSFGVKYEKTYNRLENIDDSVPVTVCARLSDYPEFVNGKYRYIMDVKNIKSASYEYNGQAKIYVYTSEKLPSKIGSEFTFTDKIYMSSKSNKNLLGKGIFATFYSDNISLTNNKGMGLIECFTVVRSYILKHIDSNLKGDLSAIVSGISVGDTSSVNSELKDDFMRCGGSHIMAVSGLHASLIAAVILYLLLHIGFDRKIALAICIPAVFFFAGISGFNYSTVRSAIMFTIYALSIILFKDYHSLTALGIAVILICLYDPFAVFDVGFLLSVSSVFGMLLVLPVVTPLIKKHLLTKNHRLYNKISYWFFTAITVSVSCSVFSFPVSSIYFNEISVISPVTNLILVPAAQMVLTFSVISCLFSLISFFMPVSQLFMYLSGFFALIIKKTATFFGSLSYSSVNTGENFVIFITINVCFICAVYFCFYRTKNKIYSLISMALSIVLVFVATCSVLNYNKTEVYVVDTQKGVCVAVIKNKTATVIGTGEDDNNFNLKMLLERKNIKNIECLFLPELSVENSNGAPDLMLSYDIEKVVIPTEMGENFTDILSVGYDYNDIFMLNEYQYFNCSNLSIQMGSSFVRVFIGSESFTVCFDDYNVNEDALDGDKEMLITNIDNGFNIDRRYSVAFISGKTETEQIKDLETKRIKCYFTNANGNIRLDFDDDKITVYNNYF